MKDDEMPDYSLCSLNQLFDIAAHVNREKFPERYEAVRQSIEKCESQPKTRIGEK